MTDVVEFATDTDYRRDRWGRPLIVPPGGGKPKPYTRSSSAAKVLEDTFGLELWSRRNVAFGFAHDASLAARVLAIGGTPSSWDQAAKKEVNGVVEDAANIAQAHKAADIGTALHRMCERSLRGEEVDAGIYEADLLAFLGAIEQMGWVVDPDHVECRIVSDGLELAGTCDLIVRDGRRHHVADIKTGATVAYGGLGYSAQLAAYASGTLYDTDTDTRLSTPRIDQSVGWIIHLPAGTGSCSIYRADLVAGRRACEMAAQVRQIRREAKGWLTEHNPAPTVPDCWTDLDDGATVNIGTLEDEYRALGAEPKAWIGSLVKESQQHGVSFHMKGHHTARRASILRCLVLMGRHVDFDAETTTEQLRELLACVLGTEAAEHPTIAAGYALGACTADQAAQLELMVRAGWE